MSLSSSLSLSLPLCPLYSSLSVCYLVWLPRAQTDEQPIYILWRLRELCESEGKERVMRNVNRKTLIWILNSGLDYSFINLSVILCACQTDVRLSAWTGGLLSQTTLKLSVSQQAKQMVASKKMYVLMNLEILMFVLHQSLAALVPSFPGLCFTCLVF